MFTFAVAVAVVVCCDHRKFRLKWPWEQDRQMALYNRSSQLIQVASQPEKVFMSLRAGHVDNGWCLSHLPEAGCFFSHYCANAQSKQVMKKLYTALVDSEFQSFREIGSGNGSFPIEYIHF
jgi:hypothetical protein